jgi:hypothetical protein
MNRFLRITLAAAAAWLAATLASQTPASAAQCVPGPGPYAPYSSNDLIVAGHRFFGDVSQGLATIVERAVSKYGLPNGYILGQEGSGAIIGGLRYGEGTLSTKNAGQCEIFWQGPSIGPDLGGNGDRVMMLVYNLPDVRAVFRRYYGVAGSAYVVAGFGMTVLSNRDVFVVPIVSGVGARFGLNLSYLKFTDHPTWNPF